MPLHFNDAVDDPLLFDAQRSFLGGMVSNTRVNLLSPDQAALLQDVDVEQNGRLRTRRGFRDVGDLPSVSGAVTVQAFHWYDSATSQFLLAFAGGKLLRMGADNIWHVVESGAVGSATDSVFACQVDDRVFAVSSGSIKTTHWNSDDLTGAGSGSPAGTTITDGPARLSLLTSQRFRLFGVNPAAIDELWASKFLPSDAAPFTLSSVQVNPLRIGEGEGDPITALFAWKGFILLVFKQASIWSVDTTPALQANTTADAANNQTAAFVIQRVSGRVGCVASRSVSMAGNDVLWLARDGVRSLQKTLADPAGAISDALSYPVDDYIQRINWSYAAGACAAYWNGRYILAVPLDNSSVNNGVLVYHAAQNRWQVWTGLQPVQFAVTRFPGQPEKLAMLDARGNVTLYQDFVPQGQAVAVHYRDNFAGADFRPPWKVCTRALTWNELANPKQPDFVEFEFDRSTALVDLNIGLDGNPGAAFETKVPTGAAGVVLLPGGVVLPWRLGSLAVTRKRFSMLGQPNAREIIFELAEAANMSTAEASASGYLSLRSILAGAFLETLEEQS
jgi:hypothetical protein